MSKHLLIAVGGHIDHGKTSFIKSLNGFDGDQNHEEKTRGMTLDLSFSDLKLPKRNVSFIDVPGHEKLVKNMIAGAFGVDLLCLIIACDDGIMPQTLEHLQIANFLKIPRCFCILSKSDKATPHKLELLAQEIHKLFQPLQIQLDRIFPFTILQAQDHLPPILDYLNLTEKPHKKDIGFFRYYIDRAFSLRGAGCIVSGTSLSGAVKKGDKLIVYDLNKEVQVKEIKIHSSFQTSATRSNRVALNLSGIHSKDLKRGFLIAPKGFLRGFDQLDVVIYGADQLPKEAMFHIGAKRTSVQITPLAQLDSKVFLATLKTQDKIFAIFKESFVLRDHQNTIYGGEILSPIIDPIKKSQKALLLSHLWQENFSQAFALLAQIHLKGFGLISSTQRFALNHDQALNIAKTIPDLFVDSQNLVLYSDQSLQHLKHLILQTFAKNPNALLSSASLKIKYHWASQPFIQHILDTLQKEKKIVFSNGLYTNPNNHIKNPQDFICDRIFESLQKQGFSPIAPYNLYQSLDLDRKSGDQALKKLCASQKVVRLEHNLFITAQQLNEILKLMRQVIEQHGYIDLNLFKTILPLSRKYLITYLDYLDSFEDIIKLDTKRVFKHNKRFQQ
ncbi:selenocysteine-specific translation elongation factor [Helicobacter enhydrae]|uniref:Selenocysteine-specific translation elongation factor n=1 Tax=Helicobacter enhydrae TaxID=222136 RepID=A0A1B1U6F3_9HELI|nr:selenocysteine-specific translation elongation factor [Helicobacter enhydrae]ANV98374.1 selenocysteine-specific translation elongation factor [Helicobacter enhydrae]